MSLENSSSYIPSRITSGHERKVWPVGSSLVGGPTHFVGGQFAGRSLRAELSELQKADLGRKYARKDRRPLDPPPVVQLRLFEILHAGTPSEVEQEFEDYDEIKSFGVLCHVDLFPVPDQGSDESDDSEASSSTSKASATTAHGPTLPPESSTAGMSWSGSNPYHSGYSPSAYATPQLMPSSLAHHIQSIPAPLPPPDMFPYPLPAIPATSTSFSQSSTVLAAGPVSPEPATQIPRASPGLSHTLPRAAASRRLSPTQRSSPVGALDPDIIAYIGDYAIRESTKCTADLAGATFVQSSGLEYKGRKALMFVFSDLAVKTEGTFILRYRVFNIFSQAVSVGIPILAQCYGGPFKIWPSKEFPGLRPSTDLTKHISRFGVRLNLRETERKRRKQSDALAERTTPPSANESSTSSASADTSDRNEPRGKGKERAHDIDGQSEGNADE